ncbi:MAG: hypothetical protein LBC03_02240 [Nitrososphaerota archaeon]|jgi:hypothetical protein|nr:hypothetical protein [Nitrososphaerota archaeon]
MQLPKISSTTSKIIDLTASIISSLVVGLIALGGGLNWFESFMLGIAVCTAWRVLVIWRNHGKSVSAHEEFMSSISKDTITLKECVNGIHDTFLGKEDNGSIPLGLVKNFKDVEAKYRSKKLFIVELYETELKQLNAALISHNKGIWASIKPDVFEHHAEILFKTDDDANNNYFCAISDDAEIEWFASSDGVAYLENIDNKIKNKSNIRRLLRIDDRTNQTDVRNIFLQLHINSKYQIKIIEKDKMTRVLKRMCPNETLSGVGIWGKKFMWKNTLHPTTTCDLCVNADKIDTYTNAFNEAWADSSAITPSIPHNIKQYCKGKTILDLQKLLKNRANIPSPSNSNQSK